MSIIVGKKLKQEFLNRASARTVIAKRVYMLMLEATQVDDYSVLMRKLGRLVALSEAYESDEFTSKLIQEGLEIEKQGLEEAFEKPYFSEFGCLKDKKATSIITGDVN